jgi:hypothetical protein
MYHDIFEYLVYLHNKFGLYIFYEKELIKVNPFVIDSGHTSGIEFFYRSEKYNSIFIKTLCENYYLFGNVLFKKGFSIEEMNKLYSTIPIDSSLVIDLERSDYRQMIDKIKRDCIGLTDMIYMYKEKDNHKANKAVKNNKEQSTMKNKFSDIINMKMMMSIINNKGEIDLTKLMVLQSFAKDGNIEVTDIIKTKLTEKILKDVNSKEDLPLEKLALINMLDNGSLDLQEIIKYKMLSSDDMDMEKMMMMSCMTDGGDITDIIKYKMMMQMLKETETEKK